MNRQMDTHVWECVELEFCSAVGYDNPFLDVELQVEFLGPQRGKITYSGVLGRRCLMEGSLCPNSSRRMEMEINLFQFDG